MVGSGARAFLLFAFPHSLRCCCRSLVRARLLACLLSTLSRLSSVPSSKPLFAHPADLTLRARNTRQTPSLSAQHGQRSRHGWCRVSFSGDSSRGATAVLLRAHQGKCGAAGDHQRRSHQPPMQHRTRHRKKAAGHARTPAGHRQCNAHATRTQRGARNATQAATKTANAETPAGTLHEQSKARQQGYDCSDTQQQTQQSSA